MVYLNNILIVLKIPQVQIFHTNMVSTLLKETGETLQLMKCVFFTNHIDYLVHVVKSGRLEYVDYTADAMSELQISTTITELCSITELRTFFG